MLTLPEALTIATAHYNAGRLDDAENAYREIVSADPTNANAWHLLGVVAYRRGNHDRAAECALRSLALKPDQADVHNNLGLILHEQGRLDEAAECYRRALMISPEYATAHYNLGRTRREQGKLREAAECYRNALKLRPDDIDSHVSLATLNLLAGDFERGWPEYEWRLKADAANEFGLSQFMRPKWRGEPLRGKTIVLHAEQGFGDTIQFIRYAPLLRELGANVIVGCKKPLKNLLASCPGISRLISDGDELPPYEFYSPFLSVPGILKTSLNTVASDVPYLFADPALVDQWHEKLSSQNAFLIGINWRGQGGQGSFRNRDIPLEYFSALTSVPGAQVVRLQKEINDAEKDLIAKSDRTIEPGPDSDTSHGAFMDTAAIMMNLDLVITSDTSIAHLAGALGVPIWVALPFIPDWRWLLDRPDSPWYPTMRLFRQKSPGDWASVFQEIQAALRERLSTSNSRR